MRHEQSEAHREAWRRTISRLSPELSEKRLEEELPLLVVAGEGHFLIDYDGHRILDFNSLKNPFGHAHPALVSALTEQAGKVWDPESVPSPVLGEAAARVTSLLPDGMDTVAFFATGSEAVEAALRLARDAVSPRRKRILGFHGGYHGWSFGSLLASAHPAGTRTKPAWLSTQLIDPPRCLDALPGDPLDDDGSETLAALESHFREDKSLGILIVEPVQLETGVRVAPPGFWGQVRELCDRHEVLVIADEVSTGGFRNGELLAAPELRPDLVVFAKAITGGLGACLLGVDGKVLARKRSALPSRNNLLVARTLLAVLDEAERLGLEQRAPETAAALAERLAAARHDCDWIGHGRAWGLLGALEVTGEAAEERAAAIARECILRSLRLSQGGPYLYFFPPLDVSAAELDTAFEILREAGDAAGR